MDDKIDIQNILKNSFQNIEKNMQQQGSTIIQDLTKLFNNTDPITPTTNETILTNSLDKLNTILLELQSFTIIDLEFLMKKIQLEPSNTSPFLMMIISALRNQKR